jgi:hypothetical protein
MSTDLDCTRSGTRGGTSGDGLSEGLSGGPDGTGTAPRAVTPAPAGAAA